MWSNMTEITRLMSTVQAEAARIDAAMRADLDRLRPGMDPLLAEVLDYGLFNGGKRIRPLLVVLSARLCGTPDDRVYELAKAFEYLHAATLFHDDVIDNAVTRRGRPAVNRQFGLVAAILAGDFLHARSMEIVGDLAGGKGLHLFCQATAGMVDGEFRQLRNAAGTNLSEDDYAEAIMGKTGLLIAASCEIGAMFGGGSAEQQAALHAYGVGLGSAFQMIDDLLDYTGNPWKTGKAVGNDLIEGKMTLPLIGALARANPQDRRILEEIVGDQVLRQNRFEVVSELIAKYDGFGETRRRAEQAVAQANLILTMFSGEQHEKDRETLVALAGYVLTRQK
jgi:octaprenyl-diphosphate synthase